MNPAHIRDIITAVKADDSIKQPWKNYALKELEIAIVFIEKGKTVTNLKPPAGMPETSAPGFTKTAGCTCPSYPDMVDSQCPVHKA